MGDKDRPFSFEGMKLGIIDGDGFKKLPIVEDSVEYSGYYVAPEFRNNEPVSFSVKVSHAAELLLLGHPDVQRCIDYAQKMLDEIKVELNKFYRTDPPRNRKERRKHAKVLEMKINRFKAYCRAKGIEFFPNKFGTLANML